MGMKIIETSGNFVPSNYGLVSGDVIDIICVGGGASGGSSGSDGATSVTGGDSSFGSYVSSANGIIMGKGQVPTESYHVGCGAGGYMPGVPFYGGNGGLPVGLAGTVGTPISPYCNPGGPGNKGATGGYSDVFSELAGTAFAPGGNGYGAGGGGYTHASSTPYNGGDAGKIIFGSVVISNPDTAIAVVVGAGGINAGNSSLHGAPGVVLVFW